MISILFYSYRKAIERRMGWERERLVEISHFLYVYVFLFVSKASEPDCEGKVVPSELTNASLAPLYVFICMSQTHSLYLTRPIFMTAQYKLILPNMQIAEILLVGTICMHRPRGAEKMQLLIFPACKTKATTKFKIRYYFE